MTTCQRATYTEQVFNWFGGACYDAQFIARDEMESRRPRQRIGQLQYVGCCISTKQPTAQ